MAVDDGFARELLHHHLADFVSRTTPDVDHLVVAFALGHETGGVLLFDRLDLVFGGAHELELLLRHGHVADADRDAGAGSQTIAVILELVGEDHRRTQTAAAVAHVDQTSDFLLLERAVEFGKAHALGQDFRQKRTADSRFVTLDDRTEFVAAFHFFVFADANRATRLQSNLTGVQSTLHFSRIGKEDAFARRIDAFTGGVVQAEHHILRRHDGRIAVGREEHVVRREHQATSFELGFKRQRDVHSHLVTVEVGVESRANERVQLDGLAFDQLRLKGLNAETVQGRCTVEHHGMLVNHFFQDVPNDGFLVIHHLLCALDRGRQTALFELIEDEGLEEFQRHQLGQTALMQTQFRTHRNHGTAGVVDALAEQVLTEAAGLALDHVGERLQRTLGRAGHRLAATAVVEQTVDSFLQHALFVAHDDVRRLEFKELLQTIVAVDDAAIQIVQIGGRKAAAVERHQRTQVGRKHRKHFQNHPFGLDAGALEAFEHLQALGKLLDLGFRGRARKFLTQVGDFLINVNVVQKLADGLGTHHRLEVVAILFGLEDQFLFREQLAAFKRREAGVDHAVGFEIKHAFDVAQRNVEHHAHTGGQAL